MPSTVRRNALRKAAKAASSRPTSPVASRVSQLDLIHAKQHRSPTVCAGSDGPTDLVSIRSSTARTIIAMTCSRVVLKRSAC